MKILIVRLFPDEININNYNVQELGLAKALVAKGHVCDIVLYTNKKENYVQNIKVGNNNNIKIYWLTGKKFFGNAFFNKQLMKIIQDYDIIQSGGYDQIYNVFLMNKIKKPMVIYHGNYYSAYSKGYKKKCLLSDFIYSFNKKYKEIQFISKSEIATKFLKEKGFYNIATIGVGLDTDRFKQNVKINDTIKEIVNNKEDYKYLLYIGKMEERRNIIFLLKLIKDIVKDNPNFKLVLVGNGEDEYLKKCNEFIKNNHIEKYIIYIKGLKQEELSQLYKISDMFLLPTKHEIFGMVLLEAMYFGVPALTTYNGGSSVLIKNNFNGFIENMDIEKWKKTIIENIDNIEVKINAKNTIEEEYTWNKLSNKFINVYNTTIERFKGRK